MRIWRPKKLQILWVEVVRVAVGDQQGADLAQIQAAEEAVEIVVRGQVQQMGVVDLGLGQGADVLSAQKTCLLAHLTLIE